MNDYFVYLFMCRLSAQKEVVQLVTTTWLNGSIRMSIDYKTLINGPDCRSVS